MYRLLGAALLPTKIKIVTSEAVVFMFETEYSILLAYPRAIIF